MSAETEKLFNSLLQRLRPIFKENGFRSSRQNFILESDECWVIVSFQKSRWVDSDATTFYVNVAASAKRWLGFEGKSTNKVPAHYKCDWSWRVEHFGPDRTIHQWTLRDEASLEQTFAYLQSLFLEFVFPVTRTMTTESQLMKHSGGFEYPQLKTRSVILAATNQVEALKQTVTTLIEKFSSGVLAQSTRDHLELLRSKYPEAMRSIEDL